PATPVTPPASVASIVHALLRPSTSSWFEAAGPVPPSIDPLRLPDASRVNASAPDPPTRLPIPVKLRVVPFTVPVFGALIVQLVVVAESGPLSVLLPAPPMIDPLRLPLASRLNVLSPATPVSVAILEKPPSILPTLPESGPLIVQVLPVSHVKV